MAKLYINAEPFDYQGPGDTPLLWVLRDDLSLTGTKFGCGLAQCGACTVLVDGVATRSCVTPMSAVTGKRVTTIEDAANIALGKRLQQAWLDQDVVQCGYCQSGQIMSAMALLQKTPKPNDKQIDEAMAGNICRCGTYNRVQAAIKQAAGIKA
jgi:isoquinoline 1-oxidoreductase subunit alpha